MHEGTPRIVTTNAPSGVEVLPSSVVSEVDPYDLIRNVKVIDTDSWVDTGKVAARLACGCGS